jgi:hypothetical protein
MIVSVAPERPANLRANIQEIEGRKIEVLTTPIARQGNLLLAEQVEMLRVDTRDRLLPLARQLTQGKQFLLGHPYDSNDPDWLSQMEPCSSLDEAIARLRVEGVDTSIIDFLDQEDGVLSVGFMQLERLGSGFGEVFPESEVQFIHALS